jgi:alkylation response protein AidB-like acyl-CoA dehydrogenase
MHHQPNPADIDAILSTVLDAPAALRALPPFADFDLDLQRQVLEEAAKFVGSRIAPLQRVGDEVGCRFDAGTVTAPPGFREAYQAFWQAGWPALASAPEHGGQGLPAVLEVVLYEMLSAANHGWTMGPGILHGAYDCLRHHGNDTVRGLFLDKLATGEWLATMCLTEPQAGSDLGLVRTRAQPLAGAPAGGPSHHLSGTKIFISGGEHDMSDNIVHLVLARLPDAPPGPKGLSLFVAPKWLPDGSRNTIHCERIEEKMGLHGSATCVMRFDDAQAWPVGEPHRGLNAMFVMMNAARLNVALQGVGLLDAAHQKAAAYAQERRQMRAPGASSTSLIGEHPAVRRILATQRIWVDTARVLAYHTALELDIAKHHPEPARRAAAASLCGLATPIMKAAFTHQGFHGASECLQVFGGHGYVSEWGVEQIVRDARVAMIYEGTNEIQAIDLLVRKVLPDGAAALAAMFDGLGAAPATARRFGQLIALARGLGEASAGQPELPYWVADDFLRACALALLGWAGERLAAMPQSAEPRWSEPLAALGHWVLPEFEMRVAIMERRLAGAAEQRPVTA